MKEFSIETPEPSQVPATPGPNVPRLSQPSPHPVFWMIAGALVAIAIMLMLRPSGPSFSNVALGQMTGSGGARGVFAFTGQLSKGNYGVFLVDADAMTIWAYEYLPQKSCLRLAASRTWRYDRYLENYNCCELPPEEVEKMIDTQRQDRLQKSENEMP